MQNKQTKPLAPGERSSSVILRSLIAQLLKVTFFALAALIVIFVGTGAWFAANNQVEAGGAQIQGRNSLIRLATKGDRQDLEKTYLRGPNGEMLSDGTLLDGQAEAYYYTENGTIALRLNGQEEISPGAAGEVTFYIIPSERGELNTTVYLQLAGYQEGDGIVSNNPILNTLLNGHILLFCGTDYSNWLGSDETKAIPISIKNAQPGVPAAITLSWIWPLRYHNMVTLPSDTKYRDWLDTQKVANNQIESIAYKYNHIFLVKNNSNLEDDDVKDDAYNLADEFIGTNADYLYLTIRTSP